MIVKIERQPKEFKPVTVNLTFETKEELDGFREVLFYTDENPNIIHKGETITRHHTMAEIVAYDIYHKLMAELNCTKNS